MSLDNTLNFLSGSILNLIPQYHWGRGMDPRGEEVEGHTEPHPHAAPVRQTPHLQRGRLAPPPAESGQAG